VIVTNTGRNRIQVVDLDRPGHFQEVGLSRSRWDRLSPSGPFGDHLNSVHEKNGKLYAVAHGHRNGSRIAVFTYPDLSFVSETKVPNVTGAHNIFVDRDGKAIGCHSEVGGLIDFGTGELLWESGSPVYTRGLAASDDLFLIGESEITSREGRKSCPSGIWLVERRSLRTADYIPLGPYGAVHEVRLVDVPDHAHHGTPLAGGAAALKSRASLLDRAERLKASLATSRFWKSFTPVLGQVRTDEEGWKTATAATMLAVLRHSASELSVDYRLSKPPSHASLIAGYHGNGDDKCMDAFILQSQGADATLTLWRHGGDDWNGDPSVAVGQLPLSGRLSLKVSSNLAEVLVDERPILSGIPLKRPGATLGRLGVRAMSASIRPVIAL
jgi:hypothetical protein